MTTAKRPLYDPDTLTRVAKHNELKVRYCHGYNNAGTSQDELLMVAGSGPDALIAVVLSGISRLKAEAIALILNAPEGGS